MRGGTCAAWLAAALLFTGAAQAADAPRIRSTLSDLGDDAQTPVSAGTPARGAAGSTLSGTGALITNTTSAGAVDPDEYIVGPGDTFQLNLSGGVTHTEALQVGPEGALFLPGIGSIDLAGRSLREARAEVLRRLREQFRNVTTDFRLVRPRSMQVYVTGAVQTPGPIVVSGYSRVADVLVESVLLTGASRRNIVVTRAVQHDSPATTLLVDLMRFRLTGDMAGNPRLRDADVIQVPAMTSQVQIRGAVPREGSYELGPTDSLRTLIALAGDPLPSASGDGLLVRFSSATRSDSIRFLISDVRSGVFSPPLRDGDHVYLFYVPRYHELQQAAIMGEISRPGYYPIVTGVTRLSDLVSLAGGFLDRANLASIRVFRASSAQDYSDTELKRLSPLSRGEMTNSEYESLRSRLAARREDFRVDWSRVLQVPELDMVLQDMDVVRVEPIVATVRVEGEVRRPGVVQYAQGRSVEDYIRLVGGYSRRSSHSQVRVTRTVTGQSLLARDLGTISPGDLIWVPERSDLPVWQTTQSVILLLAQIATVILAIKR